MHQKKTSEPHSFKLCERAVRRFMEHRDDYRSEAAALVATAVKIWLFDCREFQPEPLVIMQRRNFMLLVATGITTVHGHGMAGAGSRPHGAAARIGARLLARLPAPKIAALRAISQAPGFDDARGLAPQVAADYRAGRIVKLDGIHLAQSEAAFCLAAALSQSLS